MILVDTSVWIDYFAGRPTTQVELLDVSLDEGEIICICGVILTEVLQGIRFQHQYSKVKEYFDELMYLPMDREIFQHAADIYRSLRQQGVTIRKPLDCMIAAVALENNLPLLHNDRDFEPFAHHFQLKTIGWK